MNLVIICTTIVLIFNILSDVFLFLNIYLILVLGRCLIIVILLMFLF